ncbi:ZIP zinc transporter-domain-containing protein [Pseudomassariella vexata]|uniref:ZIP zinc transporter-domain-containing protein n=1 Tax=Pseudomassariella vexata TaxID=1141098 RepID=A0A1Y2E1A4_9PEZI|nr:ZIP zinc transporter-domain-containing protein [Pseudomassariella vexata]ORY65269.1 ZIP zinc transporter-domain-containing protein [Pseudomassariella vexata]
MNAIMAVSGLNRWLLLLLLIGVVSASVASNPKNATGPIGGITLADLEERIQLCPVVVDLNTEKLAASSDESTLISRIFSVLFPGSPAVNALLATLYISGPPNFLLALCPPNIDPASLSVMVAFAVGGLMGDTLFHLLPEIFLGEDSPQHVRFVLVEPNRNLLLGVAILVGFMTFVAMDKGLRIALGGEGHDHSHGNHTHSGHELTSKASSTAVDVSNNEVKSRKKGKEGQKIVEIKAEKDINPSVKLGGYLNMIADFTHNITDGLAMSASFYASPTIGATTALAVGLHEIPHEVGDFALLIQSGFSKRAAIGAQFVTASGALLGTLIGIAVQEFGGNSEGNSMGMKDGLYGTSLTWGDMLLPFTAGTFLYVGTVGVIPELLETGPNKKAEAQKTLAQFVAVALGAGIMLYISWS